MARFGHPTRPLFGRDGVNNGHGADGLKSTRMIGADVPHGSDESSLNVLTCHLSVLEE
jgi:hypothetical protein